MRIIPSCLLQCFDRFDAFTGNETPSTGACSQEQRALLLPCYLALQREFPRSLVVPQILLYVLEGADFEARVASELRRAVRKGVPSFFNTLKPLCRAQPDKFAVVKRVAAEAMKEVEEAKESDPVAFVWASLFLAQMVDFEHRTQEALAYLEKAIAHTPTCYDIYLIKAQILSHAGAVRQAEASVRRGSSLDCGDRYMNTTLTKYQLKCGMVEEAFKTVSYWTKKNMESYVDLNDMQACWFETRCGEAYLSKRDVVHANRMFTNVCKYFDQFILDQFDFHPYVLRKNVISSYVHFLRTVDGLFSHPYYVEAATGRVRCALLLQNNHATDSEILAQFGSLFKEGMKKEDDIDGLEVGASEWSHE